MKKEKRKVKQNVKGMYQNDLSWNYLSLFEAKNYN
jgi:hypothetical protein